MSNPKIDGKTRPLQIRVTDDEYKQMEDKAESLGISVSAYLRLVALNTNVDVLFKIEKYKE